MARVPIEEGFFRIPEDPAEQPRLLGSRCPACGEVFFPRRLVCASCLHEGTEDTELSTSGKIYTWTYCHVPLFGKKDADVSGYGVAQIDLPEGPRVQSILSGARRTSPSAGRWRSISRPCGTTRTATRSSSIASARPAHRRRPAEPGRDAGPALRRRGGRRRRYGALRDVP